MTRLLILELGRDHGISRAIAHRYADEGTEVLAGIRVPVKSPGGNQELAPDNQARNSLLPGLRLQGERGCALLTQRWALLQHTTASPRQLTQIVRAALVLTQFEHKYIR